MGHLSQVALQKKTAPVAAQLGPWLARARAELPALQDSQLMFLAGLSTTLSARSIIAGSKTSTLGEGKQSSVVKLMSGRDSILRFEGFDGVGKLCLGTPNDLLGWSTDWTLQYSTGSPTSEITVPAYTTWDGEIPNVELMAKIRALLIDTLSRGPEWVVVEGRPNPADHLTTIRRDREFSPLAHDYCDAPDATRLQPVRLASEPQPILGLAASRGHLVGRDPANDEPLIYLAPDGDTASGVVRVRHVATGISELVFSSPSSAPIEAQRVRRRSLRMLKNLAIDFGEGSTVAATLNRVMDAVAQASEDPTRWVEAWTDQVLSPQWMLKPGALVPVAVVMTSAGQGSLLNRIVEGASSVALRHRTFTRGMTRKARATGRVLLARNAAVLTANGGGYRPYLRYVSTRDLSEGTVAVADNAATMFWDVCHAEQVGSSTTTSVILTTGLGITDGTIVYGNELLTYLDAFCSASARHDEQIRFQTIGLRVPVG